MRRDAPTSADMRRDISHRGCDGFVSSWRISSRRSRYDLKFMNIQQLSHIYFIFFPPASLYSIYSYVEILLISSSHSLSVGVLGAFQFRSKILAAVTKQTLNTLNPNLFTGSPVLSPNKQSCGCGGILRPTHFSRCSRTLHQKGYTIGHSHIICIYVPTHSFKDLII